MANKGFKYETTKITGPLQEKIERRLLENLRKIGFIDVDYETLTQKQGLFFYKALKWLKGGDINGTVLPERERFAKTGWNTYRIWAIMPYYKAKVEAQRFKAKIKSSRFAESYY